MAIVYKGFYIYLCDPTTYEDISLIGNFEFCFITGTGLPPNGTTTVEGYNTMLDNVTTERLNISGVIGNDAFSGEAPDEARAITPLIVDFSLLNDTGSAVKIKLKASNGYYAISDSTLANNAKQLGNATFSLYDDNDVLKGNFDFCVGFYNYSFAFGYVHSLTDGQLDPTDTGCYVEQVSCHYNNTTNKVYNYAYSFTMTQDLADWWNGITPYSPQIDPYADGGISEGHIGGGGTFGNLSDSVDFPTIPTLSAVNTGFIQLFNPTLSDLNNLANYLWGSLFDVSTWKKIFADPMDAILGLSIVPVAVPNGGASAVTVGNISTGVSINKAASQYVEVDCGSIDVEEYWGAYLDYSPFTKAELYLPYCGTHPLNVDDIMGKTVQIKYHVDILSGACCAYVKCGDNVLYSFIGQCSSSIPISGNDWTNVINGVLSAAVSIGTMVATDGMSAPASVPALASTVINSSKPSVEKSGALGGTGGMLAIQKPYLIITRPRQALPDKQCEIIGYPSFVTVELSTLEGYTEIEQVHLEGIPATEEELNEIERILKEGVLF